MDEKISKRDKGKGATATAGNSGMPFAVLAAVCFATEAAYMCFELVAQRVMSPWFGSSNIVWTAIIGIVLASGAVGNWLGGKLADTPRRNPGFFAVLLATALLCAVVPFAKDAVLPAVSGMGMDLRAGTSLAAIALFFLPSCLMGFLVPMLVASSLTDIESAGSSTGKVYAISTVGGIAGTFAGGFVLIPALSSTRVLFVIAAVFAASAIPFSASFKGTGAKAAAYAGSVVATVLLIALTVSSGNPPVSDADGNVSFETDTEYSKVLVYDAVSADGKSIRLMDVGDGFQSATYNDEDLRNTPVFSYIGEYDRAFDARPEAANILMIGGAGYSYPKHLISTYADKRIDVVEIDGGVTELALEWFYLQDLIDGYGTDEDGRLDWVTEDGRMYLNSCGSGSYDVIMNDAFHGRTPPPALCTAEAARACKKALVPGGVYETNIVAVDDTEGGKAFLRAEVKTLRQVFANVTVLKCSGSGNYLVMASDGQLPDYRGERVDVVILDEDPVLTDDYCPVESLTAYAEMSR